MDIGVVRKQYFHHFRTSVVSGEDQGREAIRAGLVDVDMFRNYQLHSDRIVSPGAGTVRIDI
jgi:hypothetical protein